MASNGNIQAVIWLWKYVKICLYVTFDGIQSTGLGHHTMWGPIHFIQANAEVFTRLGS